VRLRKEIVKFIQSCLNKNQNTGLVVDGIWGPNTEKAIGSILQIPNEWSATRKAVGYVQFICVYYGVDSGTLDGYWGQRTQYAFESVQEFIETGKQPAPWREDGNSTGRSTGKFPKQNQSSLVKYYGKVGTNQTKINLPYPMKIAWNTAQTVRRITCHEKVGDGIVRVLDRVLDHYGDAQIKKLRLDFFGGCLNVRKMRGGSRWSTHSWGIALDFNPTENQLKWKSGRASFSKPIYEKWWDLWEEEGFVSLGRARDFDWMHVQAAEI